MVNAVTNILNRIVSVLKLAAQPFRGIWPRFPQALIGMLAILVVIITLSTYSTTLAKYSSELFAGNKYIALVEGLLNPYRTRHLLLKSGLPIYDLSIAKSEYTKIERTIEKAKKQGWMDDSLKIWAKAKFFYAGKKYKVKIRVRGDLPNHWENPKKSWRIKFGKQIIDYNGKVSKQPIYFQGRRQTNLIIPNDRRYTLSYFVNTILRDYGLITPRDQFVILRINGALQGLYYDVEHFDKPLLAAHKRPESSVFGQNDRAMHFEQYTKLGTPIASNTRFDIGTVRRLVDRESDIGLRAMKILIDHSLNPTKENFRRVRAVLDWEKYLRLRVLTTLFNTNHARFGSDNLRLYFDPSRGLLEPIPWDLHLTRLPKEPGTIDFWNNHGPDEIQRATIEDPQLRLQRNRVLWELLHDGGDSFIDRFDQIHKKIRPFAWGDVLTTPVQGHKMDALRKTFIYNVHRAHKVLKLSSANFNYRLEADDRAALEITTTNFSGIHLRHIDLTSPSIFTGEYRLYYDTNDNGLLDSRDALAGKTTSKLGALRFVIEKDFLPKVAYKDDFIEDRYWEFYDTLSRTTRFFLIGKLARDTRHPLEWDPPKVDILAHNAVTGQPILSTLLKENETLPQDSIAITYYDASHAFDLDAPERDLEAFIAAHPQFERSNEYAGAVQLSGQVTLTGTTIVPRSVPLFIKPGTDIKMMPNASVLVYSGLKAIGTAERRINIHAVNDDKSWGVLAVIRPSHKVEIEYVDVQGGNQAKINGILFTGGFAVHDGDLRIAHCRFQKMQSEDAINLKNGNIAMDDCIIADSASDSMDLDFVTGEVRNSVFIDSKGDGLDLSGSEVIIAGNRFENALDKGISVGENSHPTLINNLIRDCQIGLSTKDLSWVKVSHTTFVDNGLAIEAKRKKPMFGGAGGEFLNSVFSGNKELVNEDYFSQGKVSILSSLVDLETPRCQNCRVTNARFRALNNGDYRLAKETDFALVNTEWTKSFLESKGLHPESPGVISQLAVPPL